MEFGEILLISFVNFLDGGAILAMLVFLDSSDISIGHPVPLTALISFCCFPDKLTWRCFWTNIPGDKLLCVKD